MSQYTIKDRVVGIDIDTRKTTYAIVDVRGNILTRDSFSTLDYPNVNEFVSVLCDKVFDMMTAHGGYDTVRSVGISASSSNFITGCIENAANLPWKGIVPLAAMMRDRLGLSVALGNNAHVITLGEQAFGMAHGMKDFVGITIGTGMGSCIFCNGAPYLGSNGFVGEIGHTCVVPEGGRQCGCGRQGCLETYTAAKGVVMTARELMDGHTLPTQLDEAEELTPQVLTEYCEKGDAVAIETYRRTGHMLGLALANYAALVNPEAFVFIGEVTRAGKWLLEPAWETFNKHVFRNIEGKTKFLLSHSQGRDCYLLGASVLAWQVKEYSLFK